MASLLDLRTSPGMGELCANRVAVHTVSFEVGHDKLSEVGTIEFIQGGRVVNRCGFRSPSD
jgi:hypothetical protein